MNIPPPLEDEEQIALVQYLKLKKLFYFAVPNGAYLAGSKLQRAKQMQRLKSQGLIDGVSDIIVLLEDKILFIEMKRRPKILKSGKESVSHTSISKEQKIFLESVGKFKYAESTVAYGAKQAIEFINKHI